MQLRHYYYFVAGLADLVFDGSKSYPDMSEFREELKNSLHPRDYYLASLLFLPNDNRNLISFLEGKDDEWDTLGTYSRDDFEEQMRVIRSILKEKNVLPDYMVGLMLEWINSEEGVKTADMRKKLSEGYVRKAIDSGSRFLEKWVRFDTDLNNIFTFLNAKSLNLDPGNYLIGDDTFTQELLELFKSGKDFPVTFEPEYISTIFKIASENEFLERERKIDVARWNYIDTITCFEYFTIDQILGYLIKYSIVLRWAKLDPETGKIMLQKFIKETESFILSGNLNGS
ncbi:MAG: DUF2764 domain-containing protein [Bacteroidales bacterium]|nr:DUF2764 domain-containing protein [Bacteroidales bacterium]